MDEFLGSEEEDNIIGFCCVGCAIVFYGTFIMMFLVEILLFILGR